MDLAVYINELLGLEGEVNVPGIGHFTQVRVNGYYNEQENKFYPPTHEVNFDPQSKEDEELAKYIANKKNISLASSKYFIDKYVAGLKQQLTSEKADLPGLGYLYTHGSTLAFNADHTSKISDPAFYGLPPVNIDQPEKKPDVVYTPPVKEEVNPVEETIPVIPVEETLVKHVEDIPAVPIEDTPVKPVEDIPAVPVEDPHPPVQAVPQETIVPIPTVEETPVYEEPEYAADEEEDPGRRNTWIAILLIAIIALLALLGLYKYKPAWFDKSDEKPQTFVAVSADTAKKSSDTDTLAKTDSKPAAAAVTAPQQTINAPVDTFATLRYEILGGAFKTLSQATEVIKNYQKLGLQPRLLKHAPGNYYKITLGTYFNKEEAQKAADSILTATKINKNTIYLQPYLPKK
jgi:hypothetical protein